MKKTILAILLAVFTIVPALAKDEIQVKDGTFKNFKGMSGNIVLSIDLSQAQYDKKKPLKQEYPNLDQLMARVVSEYISEFNNECKNFKILENASNAGDAVKMNIKVNNMDRYVNVFAWKPGVTTKMYGTFSLIDSKGNVLVAGEIDDLQNEGVGNDQSFEECFEELAESLAKKINKAK